MRKLIPAQVEKAADFAVTCEIIKGRASDMKEGIVFGWAYVLDRNGVQVVDHQNDTIAPEELVKAAHDFMINSRTAGVMHARADGQPQKIGDVVESVVLTRGLQKALGINLPVAGWLIAMRLTDPEVRKLAAQGVLKSFSIGGRGKRV